MTVSETALRELVREALNNQKFGSVIVEDNDAVVNVSNVVDSSAAVTDPGDPNYVPNNRVELQVAIKALSDDLPDEKVPDVYQKLVGALNVSKEKNEVESEDKMKKEETKVESIVRAAIRKHLQEQESITQAYPPPRKFSKKPKNFGPVVGPLPPVQKIPAGVHGGEYNRRADKQKADLQKALKKTNIEDDFGGGKSADEALPKGPKNTMMTDVSGASFQEIADELGFSVAGAKQAVDKALQKAQWVGSMSETNPEDLEIIVLTSMNDYIKMLSKTGELSAADIQLMKDHPDIVRELDGFREFLDRAVRKARKPEGLENPLGESTKKKSLRENADALVSSDEVQKAYAAWDGSGSFFQVMDDTFGEREFSEEALEWLYQMFPDEMENKEHGLDETEELVTTGEPECPVCYGGNTHLNPHSNEIECADCDDSFPIVKYISKVKKESRTIRKGNLKIVLEKSGDGLSKKCKFCNQDVKVVTTTAGEYFDAHTKPDGSDCHGSKSRTSAAAVSESKKRKL